MIEITKTSRWCTWSAEGFEPTLFELMILISSLPVPFLEGCFVERESPTLALPVPIPDEETR